MVIQNPGKYLNSHVGYVVICNPLPHPLDSPHIGQYHFPSTWPYFILPPSLLSPLQSEHFHCTYMSILMVLVNWKIFKEMARFLKYTVRQKKAWQARIQGTFLAKSALGRYRMRREQVRKRWCVQGQGRDGFRMCRVTGNGYVPTWFIQKQSLKGFLFHNKQMYLIVQEM